jgi:hypothetical protein
MLFYLKIIRIVIIILNIFVLGNLIIYNPGTKYFQFLNKLL